MRMILASGAGCGNSREDRSVQLVTIAGRFHVLTGAFDDPATRAVDVGPLTGLDPDPVAFLAADGLARLAAVDPVAVATHTGIALAAAELDAIIPRPRTVWAVGVNYRAHATEMGREPPSAPTLFTKSVGALLGHGAAIVVPPCVTQPDYEGEVAVVIGRTARDVPEDAALDVIAGISIAHDVSSRDHQYTTGQWSWSKSFDTFCPVGPTLTTLDHDTDPLDVGALAIETRLNGTIVQSANTADLIFSIPRLVAWITQGQTLLPGDIILTGTPGGVGAAQKPPRWLGDGDEVAITVGGVGTLRNRIRRTGS